MDLGLKDKVAIVSGASRGIGRSIALSLAAEGAKLCICARNEEGLNRAAEEMRAAGAEVEALALDVTTAEGADALVAGAVARFGGVDILVNNVGGSVWTPFAEISDDEWNHVLNLSFMSAVRVSRAAALRSERHGHVSPFLDAREMNAELSGFLDLPRKQETTFRLAGVERGDECGGERGGSENVARHVSCLLE